MGRTNVSWHLLVLTLSRLIECLAGMIACDNENIIDDVRTSILGFNRDR